MLTSFAILFGTLSVLISTLVVYSSVVVASRTQNNMQLLQIQPTQEYGYTGNLGRREQVASFAGAS